MHEAGDDRHTHTSSARGFSLTELLVCLVIIASLISMLLPALSGVRASQRTLACSVNQRTLRDATFLYINNEGRGLLPLVDNPTVIVGTCTTSRIRQPFEAIASYLAVPLPRVPSDEKLMPWPHYDGAFPALDQDLRGASPFSCPADPHYAPRAGFSYEFVPSQYMMSFLTGRADPSLRRPVSLFYEQRTYEATTVLWQDLHTDGHTGGPPEKVGMIGAMYDGKIGWVGPNRKYAQPRPALPQNHSPD